MHLMQTSAKPMNWPLGNVDNPLWVNRMVTEGMQAGYGYEIMPPVYPGGNMNVGCVPSGCRPSVPAPPAERLSWSSVNNRGYLVTKHMGCNLK